MSIGLGAQEAIFTQVWVSRYETCIFSEGLRVVNEHHQKNCLAPLKLQPSLLKTRLKIIA